MLIFSITFQIIGSLGLLLYGMKLMSDGIQKSAGTSLHTILNFMTGNRMAAVLTGIGVTALVQSSSATTVMTVSFVNAGLLTLKQSIGVIFGANVGTTITAWIVSLIGFKFKLAVIAIPVFGIGYFLTFFKRLRKEGLGEALMGFGLLFVGLEILSKAMPTVTAEQVHFVAWFADKGALGLVAGVLAGMLLTIIIHSSSASTAIILTMSHNGLLDWNFAAAMILGSNIGTTIDAVIAAIGAKLNARRAAAVHVLFNLTGSIIAIILFTPFLALVEFIVPGDLTSDSITTHLAMLHTIFNISCTVVFLPFVNLIGKFVEKLIKPGIHEPLPAYKLDFPESVRENAESYVFHAEKELLVMSELVKKTFVKLSRLIDKPNNEEMVNIIKDIQHNEEYADQMQEQLSNYLVKTSQLPLSEKSKSNTRLMLRIVDDLESMTDNIYSIALMLQKSRDKKMVFKDEDIERLTPYFEITERFLVFVHMHLNKPLSVIDLETARVLEDQIDSFRTNLKRIARKRLEEGAHVKAELLYIDIVRNIEKIGDHAFSISESLSMTS